jgi:predicted ATP-dependent endonuclease of OLD family
LAHYILTILEERDDLQVVVTTHSPYFVDACPPESVRVFGRDEDHSVKVKALTTHPEAARWLKTMHAGEFWASVGEDWLNTEGL